MALPSAKRKPTSTSGGSQTTKPPSSLQRLQERNETAQETSLGKLKSLRNGSTPTQPLGNNSVKALSPQTKKQSTKASPKRSSVAANKAPVTKGSIQSFFNNASQRPATVDEYGTSSQSSLPITVDDVETIDSDEDQNGAISLSKGSSTALAVRKRKAQHIENRGEFNDNLRSASQKFRKTDHGAVPANAFSSEDKRTWVERFAPTNLDELAVHKRKVADVRGWLEHAFNSKRNKALILKGGAGTGKTTTLRLLAQNLGVQIHEWSNPAGKDYVDNAVSSALQFEDFIGRAGRSSGLQFDTDEKTSQIENHVQAKMSGSSERQVLLIEDFPNTFAKNSAALQAFRSTIAQHLASPVLQSERPIPLILIISETLLFTNTAVADSFTTHRLLGPELIMHPHIDTIEFNTIAPTILLKALEAIVLKEARKSGRRTTPNTAVLKQIAEFGDIRSAVSALEFLCLRGDADACWSAKITFTKPKKKIADNALSKEETEALKWLSNRESTLGIFHSVGKVVYNKRIESSAVHYEAELPSWLALHKRPKRPENEPNGLMNDIGTDTDTFIAALHENYVLSCTGFNNEAALEVAEACIGNLSDGDSLSLDRFSANNRAYAGSASDSLRQEELAFQVVVRGLQYELPANVKRIAPANGKPQDAFRMFYPALLKLWRRKEEVQDTLETVITRLRSRHDAKESDEDSTTALTQSKTEMILQSLPYVSKIEQKRSGRSGLLDLMKSVVDIPLHAVAMVPITDELDVANAQDDNNEISDWATDRPVEAAGPFARPHKRAAQQKGLFGREGKEQALDSQKMDSLILEDDDIVDE